MAVLLREAIGDRLRRVRTDQHRTLREVSRAAQVSLGYLSEVERGRKEPSSELLAAICAALDLPLDELLRGVAVDIGGVPAAEPVPTAMVPASLEGGRLVTAVPGSRSPKLPVAPAVSHRLVPGAGEARVRARVAA